MGDLAPDFQLPSTGAEVCLSQRLKDREALLVFYPGDETPVCTKQLCDYRDNLDAFSRLGVDILAINPQSLDSHERFSTRRGIPFPLLCDADKSVCRSYGVLGVLGMAKRALVLVGRDGRIKYRRVDLPFFYRSSEELCRVIEALRKA